MEENALLVVGAVNSMFPEMSIKGSEPDIKRLLNSKKGIRSSCNYTNGRNYKHGFKSTSGWRKGNSHADCIKVIMCIGTGIHI